MRIDDRDLVDMRAPAFPRDGALVHIPGKGWFRFVGTSGAQIGYWEEMDNPDVEPYWGSVPQEAEPVKPFSATNVTVQGDHLKSFRGGTVTVTPLSENETDANHDFAEDMARTFNAHNIHLGIDTGFMMLPETTAVRFLVEGNGIADWVKHFLTKQQDYGDWAGELGARGQFADMYRKWPKIRKAMWDGEPLVGEQLDEVLMDLIGHCFLSLMFVKREKGEFK